MQLNFDATQYDPSQTMSVCLPLEDYYFEITSAAVEAVKDKPNEGKLAVSLRIESGPYKGTVQKDYFNIYNANPQAVQIAYKELSALCHVVGKLRLADERELIGGRGRATIGPQANNDKYSEVKQYKFVDGSLPGAAGQQQQQQQQQQPQQPTPAFAAPQQPAQPQQPAFGGQPAAFPPASQQQQFAQPQQPQQPAQGFAQNPQGFAQPQQPAAPAFGAAPQGQPSALPPWAK